MHLRQPATLLYLIAIRCSIPQQKGSMQRVYTSQHCVAVRCSMLQCVAVCCSVVKCVCSVVQCGAVLCSESLLIETV